MIPVAAGNEGMFMSQPSLPEEPIFLQALEIESPADRAVYLDRACGADTQLRAGVEALLRASTKSGDLLDLPELPDTAGYVLTIDRHPLEIAGAQIGPYTLIEEIGEGGMGVVYLAEQRAPVRRKVALKIIKPGMDTRACIARFEAERQAMAMMDHPNIAHVLEGGATESGRPYFVMDLVEGIPITEYCDQAGLATRERLELFVLVCQAIQHAHQKGIIHRDLKPSNILVTLCDGAPVPKIIDFGIAKAIRGHLSEKTLLTGLGRVMGTPMYMSPEQAEMSGLDVDTRSDIYSLGVLLYELLTGSTPFDQVRLQEAGLDEVRRVIREEEPPRPSHRLSTLDGEAISTITARRGLDARRLSRLLRDDLDWIVMKALEKDRARRYQSAADFARDVQRYLNDEPIEARPPTLADRAAKWSRRHRPLVWSALASMLIALAAFGFSTFTVLAAYQGEKELRAAAEASAEDAEASAAEAGQSAARAAKNYQMARRAIRQMTARLANEQLAKIPEMREVRRRLLEDAVEFYTTLVKINPDDPGAYFDRARVYRSLRQYDKVRGDYEKACELAPDNAYFHYALAEFLGTCPDVARQDLQSALLHARWAVRLAPQNRAFKYVLATVYGNLGQKDKAAAEMRQAAELCTDQAERIKYLARACSYAGDLKGAVEWSKKAVALAPDNPDTYQGLGELYVRLEEYENAIAATTKAIELIRNLTDESAESSAHRNYRYRGDAYTGLKMYEQALADYDRCLELMPVYYYVHKRRALVHFRLKNYDKALADIAKAIELAPADYSTLTWIPLEEVAKCADEGFRKGILQAADKAVMLTKGAADAETVRLVIYRALATEDDFERALQQEPGNAAMWLERGSYHGRQARWAEAIADYDKALAQRPDDAKLRNSLAWQLSTSFADRSEASTSYALQLAKKAVEMAPNNGAFWNTLGVANYRAGQWKAAVEALEKSLQLQRDNAWDLFFLAMAHWQLGDREAARDDYRKGVAWMEEQKCEDVALVGLRAEAAKLLGVSVKPVAEEQKPTDIK
jgi:serine/threonine protein kinase/Flp pilus assembly protein TadD